MTELDLDLDLDRGPFWFGGAGIGNLLRTVTDDDARATVDAAWDAGVRGFDTAPHYGLGLSERRLGAALAERPRETRPSRPRSVGCSCPAAVTATTGVDGFAVPNDSSGSGTPSPVGVRRSLDESLGRLGLDHVDVAYLHDPDVYDAARRADPGAADARRAAGRGRRRAVGVGSNSVAALSRGVTPDCATS